MTRYTSRADLLIAAGESIKMQTAAGIEPMQKYGGSIMPIIVDGEFHIGDTIELNEFPLAVVEGKPVFVGDELYMINPEPRTGDKVTIEYSPDAYGNLTVRTRNGAVPTINLSQLSWLPPKPKTVMVELTIDEAEYLAQYNGRYDYYLQIAEKTRKALEKA